MDVFDWLSQRAALDIATSISLIGACAAFIYRESKESKRKTGEERERLRVEKLTDVIRLLETLMFKLIQVKGRFQTLSFEEKATLLLSIHNKLSREILPTIIMFGKSEDALKVSQKLLERKYYDEFNENKFLFDLCIIKRDIMIHSRLLMSSDESDNGNIEKAKDIIDDYLKEKYQIPLEDYKENVLHQINGVRLD